MPSHVAMKYVGKLFERFPIIPVLLFGLFAGALAYGFWGCWNDLSIFRGEPRVTSLYDVGPLEPGKKIWVTLTGLEWKCSESFEFDGSRTFPLRDGVTGNLVAVEPRKEDQCGSGNPTGLLYTMSVGRYEYLKNKNWPLLNNYPIESTLTLCLGCTAEDARIGLYITGVSFLFCLVFILLYLRKMRNRPA